MWTGQFSLSLPATLVIFCVVCIPWYRCCHRVLISCWFCWGALHFLHMDREVHTWVMSQCHGGAASTTVPAVPHLVKKCQVLLRQVKHVGIGDDLFTSSLQHVLNVHLAQLEPVQSICNEVQVLAPRAAHNDRTMVVRLLWTAVQFLSFHSLFAQEVHYYYKGMRSALSV